VVGDSRRERSGPPSPSPPFFPSDFPSGATGKLIRRRQATHSFFSFPFFSLLWCRPRQKMVGKKRLLLPPPFPGRCGGTGELGEARRIQPETCQAPDSFIGSVFFPLPSLPFFPFQPCPCPYRGCDRTKRDYTGSRSFFLPLRTFLHLVDEGRRGDLRAPLPFFPTRAASGSKTTGGWPFFLLVRRGEAVKIEKKSQPVFSLSLSSPPPIFEDRAAGAAHSGGG